MNLLNKNYNENKFILNVNVFTFFVFLVVLILIVLNKIIKFFVKIMKNFRVYNLRIMFFEKI